MKYCQSTNIQVMLRIECENLGAQFPLVYPADPREWENDLHGTSNCGKMCVVSSERHYAGTSKG